MGKNIVRMPYEKECFDFDQHLTDGKIVHPDNIPIELKEMRQWAVWRFDNIESSDRIIKPINPITSMTSKFNDMSDWSDFDTAYTAYINSNGYYQGIGLFLTGYEGIYALQLHDIMDNEYAMNDESVEYINSFFSYTEVDPVYNLTILFRDERVDDTIEITTYDYVKFISITGNHLTYTPLNLMKWNLLADTYRNLVKEINRMEYSQKKATLNIIVAGEVDANLLTEEIELEEENLPLTDVGNAIRLRKNHGENIRYCGTWDKWLIWQNSHWEVDSKSKIVELAKNTADLIADEVEYETDPDKIKNIQSWCKRSQSVERINAMIKLAKSDPHIVVSSTDFDKNPWLLNMNSGTIDLRTGRLSPHNKYDLLTQKINIDYDINASANTWRRFLDQIMCDNQELVDYLQKVAGYSLTGSTREQKLFFLYGAGANGKSTYIETIMKLLGQYACSTPTETFIAKKGSSGINNDVARLRTARFVKASEFEKNSKLNEALIKQMTGEDSITARFLFKEFFDFKPQFKIFILSNYKLVVEGTDHGIWRRVVLIPFTRIFREEEQDKELMAKFEAELPGILNWAVEGCLLWQRDGLKEPDCLIQSINSYREEMDNVRQFTNECCNIEAGKKCSFSDLYKAYDNWVGRDNAMSKKSFSLRLAEMNYKPVKSTGGNMFVHGIDLVEDELIICESDEL
jgi:P4 family phage/plasmid primase-like protien